MTRHLLRLIWNRKRHSVLLFVEIAIAFLVVVAVTVTTLFLLHNRRQPLGFQIDDVWVLNVDARTSGDPATAKARQRDTWRQVLASLNDQPQIAAFATCFAAPYVPWSWESDSTLKGGRNVLYGVNKVSDGFAAVVHPDVIAGRWFSAEDDGVAWEAVVLNAALAHSIFGDAPAVGQIIPEEGTKGKEPAALPKRVVGVVAEFRQFGEYAPAGFYLFKRNNIDGDLKAYDVPRAAVIRVKPGTTAAFEEQLIRHLEQVAPEWSFTVQSNESVRETSQRTYLLPIAVFTVVAIFLLLMVALGLSGVLWQSVTQRTPEFGVRRAEGATAADIGRQVLVELGLLTTLAMIPGCLLLAQAPFLPLPREIRVIPLTVFVGGIVLAAIVIYAVTLASALYPSRLATRIAPVEALRAE